MNLNNNLNIIKTQESEINNIRNKYKDEIIDFLSFDNILRFLEIIYNDFPDDNILFEINGKDIECKYVKKICFFKKDYEYYIDIDSIIIKIDRYGGFKFCKNKYLISLEGFNHLKNIKEDLNSSNKEKYLKMFYDESMNIINIQKSILDLK